MGYIMKFSDFSGWKGSCDKQITSDVVWIVSKNIKVKIPFVWEKTLFDIIDDFLNSGELTMRDEDGVYNMMDRYLDWWDVLSVNGRNYITYYDNFIKTSRRFSSIIWAIAIWYNHYHFWEKRGGHDGWYRILASIGVSIREMIDNWQDYKIFIDSVKKYIEDESIDTEVDWKEVNIDWKWICLDLIQYTNRRK